MSAETAALRIAWLVLGDRGAAAALVAAALAEGGTSGLIDRVRRRAVVTRYRSGALAPHEEVWTSTRHLDRRTRADVARRLISPLAPTA